MPTSRPNLMAATLSASKSCTWSGTADMSAPRALPPLDADNRAFWTGGAQGELRLMRCADCAQFVHPPRPVCRHCLSENVAPEAVAGTGIVDTFTLNYQ